MFAEIASSLSYFSQKCDVLLCAAEYCVGMLDLCNGEMTDDDAALLPCFAHSRVINAAGYNKYQGKEKPGRFCDAQR